MVAISPLSQMQPWTTDFSSVCAHKFVLSGLHGTQSNNASKLLKPALSPMQSAEGETERLHGRSSPR